MNMKNPFPNNQYAILDTIKDGIITMDTNCKITYVNPATSILLKKPKRKIIGHDGIQMLSTHNLSLMKKIFQEMVSNHLPFRHEVTIPLNDKIVNTTFTKLVENNHYAGSLIVLQDITDLALKITKSKIIKEELKTVQNIHAKTDTLPFTRQQTVNLSHEINTSLTIILGYVSLSFNKLGPLDPMKKDLKIIQEETLRICNLTRSTPYFTNCNTKAHDNLLLIRT